MEKGRVMEQKIAHLTFIQGVITRMGQNSFLLKGWSVTIVAALFALAAQGANKQYVLVAYFPVVMFWLLDAFFLYQEKLFRKLYEKVGADEINSDDFTLILKWLNRKLIHIFAYSYLKHCSILWLCNRCLLFVMFAI